LQKDHLPFGQCLDGLVEMISNVCFSFIMALLLTTGSLHAQTPLHDPNLHTVSPEALRQLSNDRARQKIIEDSLAVTQGDACVNT
jgi:hypothetical protein